MAYLNSGSCSSSAEPTLKRKYDVFLASSSGSGNMAFGSCSSSDVPTGRWRYDVFLSFRGEDTRYNFVDHLYSTLARSGISVFKDDEELKRGKAISPELIKAIEESKFAVIVFSKNYANSSWCLAELAKIMAWHNEMGQKVIPVFYHVDPSDIRGQKNEVAVFFQQHEDKFREELDKVKEWRDALTAAANLSGFHISETFKKGESSYISKIVKEVLDDRQLSYIKSNLVGIDSHMANLYELLEIEENEEVRIVGIHGMGGVGKTTIAKALFRRISDKFEGSSFVNDVRENNSRERGLCALQEKVLKEILMTNHNFDVRDREDGANMIRARFSRKKVLIVLDDVDNSEQLEFLAATHNWFGPGSRIIITTRNEQLLSDANAMYKPKCLLEEEALELFSIHAFKTNNPPEEYKELSHRVIRCAGYLPLAVKVLGSFFCNRKAYVWESALDKLAKTQHDDIFKILRLSFDGLEDSEQKIFLDLACFFKGRCVEYATKVLDSCGFDPQIGIDILIERSLITIYEYRRIGMHDLIQEMGWRIAREDFPNTRLWQLEDIHDSLKNEQELEKIEAIMVSNEECDTEEYKKKVRFSANVFERMKNLRLLDVKGRFTSTKPKFFPDGLRWFSLSGYPFSSLSMRDMSKLVGLEVVGGTIKQFWKGQKIMPNLKIVKLEGLHYLTMFPDVSGAPNIEKLEVWNCKNFVEFHKSLGSLKRIIRLSVKDCEQLKRLPSMLEMVSLRFIFLKECPSLEAFPDVSGAPNIEKLEVFYCKNLVEFHKSLGSHKRIFKLGVINCEGLKRLPSRLEMESLETLSITRCSSLERFPDLSPCMIELSTIRLDCCCSIEGLLSSLGYLSSLEYLHLGRDEILWDIKTPMCKEQPEEHGCRERLVEDDTKALESLPKLISLNTPMESLMALKLCGRPMESEFFLKNLHSFSALRELDLSGNNNLIRLPATISHLSFLKNLNLSECHRLQILQGLPSSIEILQACNCYSLEKIDDLSEGYPFLYRISFINCHKLEKMLQLSLTKWIQRLSFMQDKISIGIPGNIPVWFKEGEVVESILRVTIPEECNDEQIKGFAPCFAYLSGKSRCLIGARCYFEKDGVASAMQEFNEFYKLAGDKGNTFICYRKCDSIRRFQREEWYGGILNIEVLANYYDPIAERCLNLMFESDGDDTDDYQGKATVSLLNPVLQSP